MTDMIPPKSRRGRPAQPKAETNKALQVQEAPPTFQALIERAIRDPSVDVTKMRELMELQKDIMAKNAEIAFNSSLARLDLPVLKHTAKIKHGNKIISTYTKYEDMDKVMRPLYRAEGFSFSFDSQKNEDKTKTYLATLSHVEGHHRTAQITLPDDTGGAKNGVQAVASTVSYAKRYLMQMLLNIVTEGEDDGGEAGGTQFITPEQEIDIDTWLETLKINKEGFLKFLGYPSLAEIPASEHQRVVNALRDKEQSLKAKGVKI